MRSTGRFSEWEKKGRFSNFEFREHRDKASLDIFWLRDESFGNPTHRTSEEAARSRPFNTFKPFKSWKPWG
jgi:hypothetical protein